MFRSANGDPQEELPREGEPLRLTRRQLLKLGLLGTGLVAAGGVFADMAAADDLQDGGKSVSRTTGAVRRAVASNCAYCLSRCSILGFTESSKLVKIEGNPGDPNSRGRLCARGQAGINRLYDPDRVLFPLQRAGGRGEGKWTRLSWEQAYGLLDKQLRAVQGGERGSVVLHTGLEGPGLMARRFAAAQGSALLLDETQLQYSGRQAADQLTLGTDKAVADIAHARYILSFGANPYESHPQFVPFVQRLVDARMGGAKLVTFDPRLSLTAGRSDEWFPVLPGTDEVVILAMANVIVQKKLHDQQFLAKWTDLAPEQLAQQLDPYTPERAEAASGMSARDLVRVATEFASIRPAVAVGGGGLEHQGDAAETQHAIHLLNALVGSVGVAGGYCPTPVLSYPEPDPAPPQIPDTAEAARVVDEMLQGKRSVGLYMTAIANPAYSWPDSEAFRKALQDESRVSYLVSIDTNLTETSMLADLVLPAATYLESWGLETPPPYELSPFVSLRQPIVKALGESISVDDILLTAGTRLDPERARFFPFPTLEGYLSAVVSKLPGLSKSGGLALLKEKGVWYDPEAKPQFRPKPDGFNTTSGKLVFKQIGAAGTGGTQKPGVVVSATGETGSDELILITYRPNVHFGDYSADSWWLSEIVHDNPLLINPAAAKQRGITHGQRVKVTSPTGSVEARVRITQGINPRVVALASSFGHTALGRVAKAERFQSSDPMTAHLWWQDRGNGVNVSVLTSGPTPSDRGLAWTHTQVKVEAVG